MKCSHKASVIKKIPLVISICPMFLSTGNIRAKKISREKNLLLRFLQKLFQHESSDEHQILVFIITIIIDGWGGERRQNATRHRGDRTVCFFWRKIWSEILWAPPSLHHVLFITTGFDIRRPWVPRYRLASSRAIHLLLAAPDSQTAARGSPGDRRYIIHQVWEPISRVSPSPSWWNVKLQKKKSHVPCERENANRHSNGDKMK